MALSTFETLTKRTTTIEEKEYESLIRQSEQLRIIKNFLALEEVYTKTDLITLVKAMEGKQ